MDITKTTKAPGVLKKEFVDESGNMDTSSVEFIVADDSGSVVEGAAITFNRDDKVILHTDSRGKSEYTVKVPKGYDCHYDKWCVGKGQYKRDGDMSLCRGKRYVYEVTLKKIE